MAVIIAIIVSLCFSLIYVIVHPEPELSVYKLITSTFASIFEQSSAASSLHSNTLRYLCLIKYARLFLSYFKFVSKSQVILCACHTSLLYSDSGLQGLYDVIIVYIKAPATLW